MSRYKYVAKNLDGGPKTGSLDAKSEYELARILRKEGLILISAESEREKISFLKLVPLPFFKKVSLVEKIMFARNLRVMIGAGVSLPKALRVMSEQSKNKKFRDIVSNMAESVTKGRTFSEALSDYPDVFQEVFSSMVRAGEESGTMEDSLKVLTSQMEKDHDLRSKVKGAMVYPAVILSAMIVIGVLMRILVVPKLAQTFNELGIELPLTTRIIIGMGNFLASFWYIVAIAIILLVILIRLALRTQTVRLFFDGFVLKIPAVSALVKKTNSAYTVRTLSSLIKAGIPIVRSLEITSSVVTNSYYKKAILNTAEEVKTGSKMATALKKYGDIYPSLVVQMVEIGEETGETSDVLSNLAGFFEEEVANATKNISTIIEPVLMIIIGIAVGFFVISMIQPMYGMIQAF